MASLGLAAQLRPPSLSRQLPGHTGDPNAAGRLGEGGSHLGWKPSVGQKSLKAPFPAFSCRKNACPLCCPSAHSPCFLEPQFPQV